MSSYIHHVATTQPFLEGRSDFIFCSYVITEYYGFARLSDVIGWTELVAKCVLMANLKSLAFDTYVGKTCD